MHAKPLYLARNVVGFVPCLQWDHAVELLGDKAIIVYPQALGDPGTGDEAVDGQGKTYRQVSQGRSLGAQRQL